MFENSITPLVLIFNSQLPRLQVRSWIERGRGEAGKFVFPRVRKQGLVLLRYQAVDHNLSRAFWHSPVDSFSFSSRSGGSIFHVIFTLKKKRFVCIMCIVYIYIYIFFRYIWNSGKFCYIRSQRKLIRPTPRFERYLNFALMRAPWS